MKVLKASELVKELQEIIKEYGDEDVYVSQDVRHHTMTFPVTDVAYFFDEYHKTQILFKGVNV